MRKLRKNPNTYYEGDFFIYEMGTTPFLAPISADMGLKEQRTLLNDLLSRVPDFQVNIQETLDDLEGSEDFEELKELANLEIDYLVLPTAGGSFDTRVVVRSTDYYKRFVYYMISNPVTDYSVPLGQGKFRDVVAHKGVLR